MQKPQILVHHLKDINFVKLFNFENRNSTVVFSIQIPTLP